MLKDRIEIKKKKKHRLGKKNFKKKQLLNWMLLYEEKYNNNLNIIKI